MSDLLFIEESGTISKVAWDGIKSDALRLRTENYLNPICGYCKEKGHTVFECKKFLNGAPIKMEEPDARRQDTSQ